MADEEEKKDEEEKEEEAPKEGGGDEEGGGDDDGDEGEEGEGEGKSKKKKFSKKKLIIMAGILVLLLGGGGGAFFFLGMKGDDGSADNSEKEIIYDEEGNPIEIDPNKAVYADLDEFIVNLNTGTKQTSFLKMTVTLQLDSYGDKKVIDDNKPRIRDAFQIYLRELRSSDLQGSAGIHRLREELLLRINKTLYPTKVRDILFKEIIVQ